ncbi:PH domain-like protein, partial [Metschnikowia bicuspidata]
SSFGANSKFSNAFQQASKKRSFLDEPEVANAQTPSPVASAPQYKQVELKAKEVKTGEENETPIFTSLAKLFELPLDKISEGWKERGVGPLHLNRSIEDPSQIRLVMRSHGILRVILNYKITPKTVLINGLDASLSPGKFLRINSISTSGAPLQYLLKFSDQTIRDSLCEKIATLQADF